uniref:BPTI/Kunitz inhibitor domain-containing protein n=1 Tax=Glossina pallidipes TaxID=7398 RepID=A0A1A9ZNB1_GLOPL
MNYTLAELRMIFMRKDNTINSNDTLHKSKKEDDQCERFTHLHIYVAAVQSRGSQADVFWALFIKRSLALPLDRFRDALLKSDYFPPYSHFALIDTVALVASQDGPAMCYMEHSANRQTGRRCTGGQFFWSYDASANSCVKFYYLGCSGNENRFVTQQQCELLCKRAEGMNDNESDKANEKSSKPNEELESDAE